MWWAIQLSLNYVFIAKFSSKKIKIDECLAKLQAQNLLLCVPCLPCDVQLKDEELAR